MNRWWRVLTGFWESSHASNPATVRRGITEERIMYEYRITLADGVMHYMTGNSAKKVRGSFERTYPDLPKVATIKRLRLA